MKERYKEDLLPIEWGDWDEGGVYGDFQFHDVVFLEDFGPFSKGENISLLWVSYPKGQMESYEGDSVTKKCSWKFQPIEVE